MYTEAQKQAAEAMREASEWMNNCPITGKSGDAMFDTFGTWFDWILNDSGLSQAYEAQMDAESEEGGLSRDDTDPDFWAAVLARI